jgi:hypothetical protein
MAFLGLDFGMGDAAKQAAAAQNKAAKKQKKSAKASKKQTNKQIKKYRKEASGVYSAAQEKDLAIRDRAVNVLSDTKDEALGRYDEAQELGLGRIDDATASAMGAYDAGETGALNALSAANTQARADLSSGYDEGKGYLTPYSNTGIDANAQQAALMGLSGPEAQAAARAQFQTDPGYEFRLNEGIGALDKSATARGGLYSGAAMKGINDYAQGQASQEYGNYYNRLSGLSGQGLQAGQSLAQMAQSLGVNLAELQARYGDQAANVLTQMAQQRGATFANAGQNASSLIGSMGQHAGSTIANVGSNQANVLAGGAQDVAQLGASNANNLLGFSGQQVQNNMNALGYTQGALANQGDAQAGGIMGQANANQLAFGNALSIGGALAGAATAPIKPTSMLGRLM